MSKSRRRSTSPQLYNQLRHINTLVVVVVVVEAVHYCLDLRKLIDKPERCFGAENSALLVGASPCGAERAESVNVKPNTACPCD